jgi:hypothetical protein
MPSNPRVIERNFSSSYFATEVSGNRNIEDLSEVCDCVRDCYRMKRCRIPRDIYLGMRITALGRLTLTHMGSKIPAAGYGL